MRILVTGGAGFIGSHIVDVYRQAGHTVVVVDDLSRGRRENLPADVELVELDVRSKELAYVFEEVQPEVVSHHAAQISVAKAVAEPMEDGSVNVLGTVNVLYQAAEYGAAKVIFASSVAVYGEPDYVPLDEDHDTCPRSPYGASKLAGEVYVRQFARLSALEATVFRYGNVYGPRQDAEGEAGVVAIFVQQMLHGAPTVIHGDGLQTRDFVYVGDVAEANLLALRAGDGGLFNLGTGRATTVRALWAAVGEVIGYEGLEIHGSPREGDIRHMVLSAERARRRLGWRPKTSLTEGLRLTAEAFERSAGARARPSVA
ncbi:MAG: NAD-dependent epimerase/dehydratase family protein [Anaerolineae bacterium]|jgi:UDP-glucose 4-epimerase